jgi:hypothetical protein
MTKTEIRDLKIIRTHHAIGNIEAAALGLSALIRCTRRRATADALMAIAVELGLTDCEEYVI